MNELKINHAAVWITALVVQVLPPLWYSEVFLGVIWTDLNQLKPADFENFNMTPGLIMAFVSALAVGYTLAWVFTKMNVDSALKGLQVALIFWLAFLFIEVTTQNMFTLRPFELTLIDEGVVLLKYEIFGIVLGSWRKYESAPEEVLSNA